MTELPKTIPKFQKSILKLIKIKLPNMTSNNKNKRDVKIEKKELTNLFKEWFPLFFGWRCDTGFTGF